MRFVEPEIIKRYYIIYFYILFIGIKKLNVIILLCENTTKYKLFNSRKYKGLSKVDILSEIIQKYVVFNDFGKIAQ